MRRLGYDRYVAQGGDVGALVTDLMGRQGLEGLAGIPPEPAHGGARNRRSPAQGIRSGARRGRGGRDVQGRRLRLLPRDGDAAADDRLRLAGFTGRAGGLAARPRHGQLLQDRRRLRRRKAHGQPHPGAHPRQHHAVLADGHRRLGGPVVLGGRTSAGRALASGQPPPAVTVPVGFTTFPGEIWATPAELGRGGLPRPHLLQRGRQGRPLRRLGGAGSSSPTRSARRSGRCAR